MRILVVENHPDTLQWLVFHLEDLHHTVFTACDVSSGVAALRTSNCDVLISDVYLPDGYGWDLLERARLDRPVFAIAMSAFGTSNANALVSKAAGYQHYLLKPFELAKLDRLLERAAFGSVS